MATRLYFSTNAAPQEYDVTAPLDSFGGAYTLDDTYAQYSCTTAKQNTTIVSQAFTGGVATSGDLIYFSQWVSPPLAAAYDWTTATWDFSFSCSENDAAADFNAALGICIVTPGSTSGFGSSPYYKFNTFSSGEPATTMTSRYDGANVWGGTAFTNAIGDRLVFLFAAFKNATASHTMTVWYGDNAASDLAADDTDTGADNPWVETNLNVSFSAEGGGSSNRLMMMGVGG